MKSNTEFYSMNKLFFLSDKSHSASSGYYWRFSRLLINTWKIIGCFIWRINIFFDQYRTWYFASPIFTVTINVRKYFIIYGGCMIFFSCIFSKGLCQWGLTHFFEVWPLHVILWEFCLFVFWRYLIEKWRFINSVFCIPLFKLAASYL